MVSALVSGVVCPAVVVVVVVNEPPLWFNLVWNWCKGFLCACELWGYICSISAGQGGGPPFAPAPPRTNTTCNIVHNYFSLRYRNSFHLQALASHIPIPYPSCLVRCDTLVLWKFWWFRRRTRRGMCCGVRLAKVLFTGLIRIRCRIWRVLLFTR